MSIVTKQELMREISEGFKEVLPQDYAQDALGVIADLMGNYEIESIATEDDSTDKDDFLCAFLDAKRVEGKSPRTIERYRYIIKRFYATCNRSPRKINVFHIRNYLSLCQKVGNSERTIEGYRTILNSYFGWLVREKLIESNPASNISSISYEKKERLPFSEIELYKIHEYCDIEDGPNCTPCRNRAIIAMLESTGCRVSEICSANQADVDLYKGECIVHGKGNKQRTVYLNDTTILLLKRYFSTRTDTSPALFIGKCSERMTPGGIRCLLKKIEERAGLTNVHPHRFRRTLATNLIDHGMPIQEVSRLLGHENIQTTMTYIHISNTSVKTSFKKYN